MERLGEYRDLAAHDPAKADIDRHIRDCASCREEFRFWQQSNELIRTMRDEEAPGGNAGSIAGKVMARIYETETWRKPVALHTYSLSWRIRRNVMICFAMCLALFFGSFLLALLPDADEAGQAPEFDIQVVTVVAQGLSSGAESAAFFTEAPVVSVGPTVLFMPEKHRTYANVYLAASIAGVIVTLLLMNWLSRLRA